MLQYNTVPKPKVSAVVENSQGLSALEIKEFEDRMLNRIHVVKNRRLFHSQAERKNINQILSEFKKI